MIKIENRKSISDSLKSFHPLANENSFIEITEWTNGEGWDITIDNRHFYLHYDELAAINYLTKHLEYNEL